MDLFRRFADEPPDFQSFRDVKPTLLTCWWASVYAVAIIFVRAIGRYVRAEKLFAEDKIMLLAIIPLMIRMAFTHVVLVYGTNNTVPDGLSALAIQHRQIGSQMVLAARIMYAAYLWAIKYSVSMFLRTLTESIWQRSHQRLLRYLHIFLAVTFVATIVADLGACQHFSHYWQVTPDPGPQCRQGSAYLITMGILNISTNMALILFPMPMILKSQLPRKRQASIIARLALPLLSIGFTAYAIPVIINRHFAQPLRSLLASFDILLATFISNATVLVSLLQDRGYKKTKYRHGTEREGFNSTKLVPGEGVSRVRHERWGSDEDLMRGSDGDSVSLKAKKDGMSVVVESIGMKDLKRDGSLGRQRGESREARDRNLPDMPGKVKLKEIRVATTWDIRVEDGEV